jgi:hypothetical protein
MRPLPLRPALFNLWTCPQARHGTAERAQPIVWQRAPEIQPYGSLTQYPSALDEGVRAASVEALNQILADTMMLRDLYKKHHWQVAGPSFSRASSTSLPCLQS